MKRNELTQSPNWTLEQIEELKRLAGTMSSSQIGKVLGRSKDAVKNKITTLGLPRFATTFQVQQKALTKPKQEKVIEPTPPPPPEPMVALYQNHEAVAKKSLIRPDMTSRIEWCPECCAPVSNWAEHFERQGHRRA